MEAIPLGSWFYSLSQGQVLSPDLVQVCACVVSLPETHTNESWVLADSKICIWNGKWKSIFYWNASRVSDKALERQEVCYFQPCSCERSMVYVGGHRGWDWHDTCVGQLWPLTKSRIKCLIIGRAAAESPEEQGRLGLTVSTLLLCLCEPEGESEQRAFWGTGELCELWRWE